MTRSTFNFDYHDLHQTYGAKAASLLLLQKAEYLVPSFVVLPVETCSAIYNNSEWNLSLLDATLEELATTITWQFSAVRSSALAEDGVKQSHAGEFVSFTNVSHDELATACQEVIRSMFGAPSSLGGAVIIQSYIVGDTSGVAFTRSPQHNTGMYIVFHQGTNESIVEGLSTSTSETTVHSASQLAAHTPLGAQDWNILRSIETYFGSAQDIEWTMQRGKLFVLQSRPITTLPDAAMHTYQHIDTLFDSNDQHYFQDLTTLGLPQHPVPLVTSIVRYLFESDGPIQRTYRKAGCAVDPVEVLKEINNTMYIDKEQELRALFPSYSYTTSYVPKPRRVTGLWRTIRNQLAWKKFVQTADPVDFVDSTRFVTQSLPKDLRSWLGVFLEYYSHVYRINSRWQYWLNALQNVVPVYDWSTALGLGPVIIPERRQLTIDTQGWIGNSLDLSDQSLFVSALINRMPSPSISKTYTWWERFTKSASAQSVQIVTHAINYQRYREYGRMGVVYHLQELRQQLLKIAKENSLSYDDMLYASWEEHLNRDYSPERLKKRKEALAALPVMPQRISSVPEFRKNHQMRARVLSQGDTTGKVISKDYLDAHPRHNGGILALQSLTSQTVQYFDRVDGIITSQGNLLAHASIIARERGLPVVLIPGTVDDHIGKELSLSDIVSM